MLLLLDLRVNQITVQLQHGALLSEMDHRSFRRARSHLPEKLGGSVRSNQVKGDTQGRGANGDFFSWLVLFYQCLLFTLPKSQVRRACSPVPSIEELEVTGRRPRMARESFFFWRGKGVNNRSFSHFSQLAHNALAGAVQDAMHYKYCHACDQ